MINVPDIIAAMLPLTTPLILWYQNHLMAKHTKRIEKQYELAGQTWSYEFPVETLRLVHEEWDRRQLVRPAYSINKNEDELLQASYIDEWSSDDIIKRTR